MSENKDASYTLANYKYIVYLMLRSAVSKYRTKTVLKKAKLYLSKTQLLYVKRIMRDFLYNLAEQSYQEFLQYLETEKINDILVYRERNFYLGSIYFQGGEILADALERYKRNLYYLRALGYDYDQQIQQLRKSAQ